MLRRRHFLAHLEPSVREAILPALIGALPAPLTDRDVEERVTRVVLDNDLPGIVCRPTGPCPEGGGQLGFAFPFRKGEERVRAAVPVSRDQISRFTSPWEVMDQAAGMACPPHPALPEIRDLGRELGVRTGLIGSAALQAMTGLPYLRPGSDIDLVIRGEGREIAVLDRFRKGVHGISLRHATKIDVEVEFQEKYGIKIDDILSSIQSVIVKTIDEVYLVNREEFIGSLSGSLEDFILSTQLLTGASWAHPSA